ncbi:Wzz/FepE/Etk N-terminal domain-containing protein [Nocardioides nitrophenolicus]|uniref:Wzz/FepE/Etk N-terminal domain-containing protein n=1 Tax=Nocardioides nitrophenolicus TaxID=60489 RepID=UPI00195D35A2|nr:Wzz/FepE/Etk N-terminal domain-containing protein [Nocardioides nitrophenolicus]MBM7520291.1 capsular polysaccharide biosynthesis protein [Nocardioides nitrophenolicus]
MSADLQSTVEIGRLVLVLRRRWAVVALVTAGLVVLASLWLVLAPSSATATTQVNVNVIATDPFAAQRTSSDLIDAATERQIVLSSEVVERAAADLGKGATARSVRAGLDAQMVTGSTVMRISWTGADPRHAQEVADAVATEYLAYRGEQATARQQDALEPLVARRDALNAQLQQTDAGRSAILSELNLVLSQITKVSGLATSGGTVLVKASDTTPATGTKASTLLLGAGVLGLILGAVVVVLGDIIRRRVYDTGDVVDGNGGPLLARLRARTMADLDDPADSDALRSVWHRLRIQIADDIPVILVIGASVGAPVAEVARALELAAAAVDDASPQVSRRVRALAVPAEEGYAVALSLAPRATVVVLVAEDGRTTVRRLAVLADHLRAVGVEPAGTVVAHRFAEPVATQPGTGSPAPAEAATPAAELQKGESR